MPTCELTSSEREAAVEELGVMVPMPDDQGKLTQALLNAVLLRKANRVGLQAQTALDFGEPAREIETAWQSARDKAAKNRSIFAQRRIKPEDVLPEWRKSAEVLGSEDDVARFVTRAVAKLGVALEPVRQHHKLHLDPLPTSIKERLAADGLNGYTPTGDFIVSTLWRGNVSRAAASATCHQNRRTEAQGSSDS